MLSKQSDVTPGCNSCCMEKKYCLMMKQMQILSETPVAVPTMISYHAAS